MKVSAGIKIGIKYVVTIQYEMSKSPREMKDKKTIASIRRENMLRYLFAAIICYEKGTVFREQSSRKTMSFEEQIMSIMSKDKYLSIFLKPNEGYCGYYPSNIFRNM